MNLDTIPMSARAWNVCRNVNIATIEELRTADWGRLAQTRNVGVSVMGELFGIVMANMRGELLTQKDMSLLDWFAGQALSSGADVKTAYDIAQAMLDERSLRNERKTTTNTVN